jgi:hypothetical protein
MKELVEFVAKQLVNHPDAAEVTETEGDAGPAPRTARGQGGPWSRNRQARTNRQRDALHPLRVAARTGRTVILEIIEDK